MKNIFALLLILFGLPLYANQSESKSIDTSAVSNLKTLVRTIPAFSASTLEERYIDKDTGGLAILGPRLTTPENLQSLYSAIKEDDWSNIQRCASHLNDLDEKVASIKTASTNRNQKMSYQISYMEQLLLEVSVLEIEVPQVISIKMEDQWEVQVEVSLQWVVEELQEYRKIQPSEAQGRMEEARPLNLTSMAGLEEVLVVVLGAV